MRAQSHYVDLLASRPAAPPVHLIAIKDIAGDPPARKDDLGPLVESVRALGVVQPLLVRRRKGRYELIAGAAAPRGRGRGGPHRGAVPAPGRR